MLGSWRNSKQRNVTPTHPISSRLVKMGIKLGISQNSWPPQWLFGIPEYTNHISKSPRKHKFPHSKHNDLTVFLYVVLMDFSLFSGYLKSTSSILGGRLRSQGKAGSGVSCELRCEATPQSLEDHPRTWFQWLITMVIAVVPQGSGFK